MYRPGKQNGKADVLTRRNAEVESQNKVKRDHRLQTLLKADQLDPRVLAEALPPRDLAPTASLLPETVSLSDLEVPLDLVDQLLTANRNSLLLRIEREAAERGDQDWSLESGLLLWRGRLVVPDVDQLRTKLIQEAHAQVSAAHPSKSKTTLLVARKYHWKGLSADVSRYVDAYRDYRRSTIPRDQTPGFLHPLLIPERP